MKRVYEMHSSNYPHVSTVPFIWGSQCVSLILITFSSRDFISQMENWTFASQCSTHTSHSTCCWQTYCLFPKLLPFPVFPFLANGILSNLFWSLTPGNHSRLLVLPHFPYWLYPTDVFQPLLCLPLAPPPSWSLDVFLESKSEYGNTSV